MSDGITSVEELKNGVKNAKKIPLLMWILLTPAIMSMVVLTWLITGQLGGVVGILMIGAASISTLVFMFAMLGNC